MRKEISFLSAAVFLLLYMLLTACGGSQSSSTSSADSADIKGITADFKLEQLWESDTSVRTPESILWDSAQQIYYVSNINGEAGTKDGNGFISLLRPDGSIKQLHWVDGLDAPKGLGSYAGKLYVADLDSLVIIDMKTAKVKTKIYIPGAVFLNDIAIDKEGKVYVSDTRQGKVFCYADGMISIYLGSAEMKGANGLLAWKDKLWINASGGIYNYDSADEKLILFCRGVKNGDGLTAVNDSDLIASQWKGEIYYVHADGSSEEILDTKAARLNTADLYFVRDKSMLVVPTFNGNKVVAYTLKR